MGDEDRDAILRRRKRLIGIALAGIASTTGCDSILPGPCLEAPIVESTADDHPQPTNDPMPLPCLEASPEEIVGEPPREPAQPLACLSPRPEPRAGQETETAPEPGDDSASPRPCLTVSRVPPEETAP